jgi:dihydroxy-acid dehydratase
VRELAARRRAWRPRPPRATRGALAKYARLVSSASEGAVTDVVRVAAPARRAR